MASSTTPGKGRATPRQQSKKADGADVLVPQGEPEEGFEVTPATQWRSVRKLGTPVTLPSGNKCRLKKTFSMLTMLENDTIPNPLSRHLKAAVEDAQQSGSPDGGVVQVKEMLNQETAEGQVALVQFLEMMMKSMSDIFVEPRVLQVPEGEDARTWEPGYRTVVADEATGEKETQLLYPGEQGAISVADIDGTDQMYAFSFAQGGVGSMAPFRNKEA